MSYANDLLALVETFRPGSNSPKIYETPDDIKLVVRAVDAGLCRLVKDKLNAVCVFDPAWNVMLGIELTEEGHRVLDHREAA